MTIADTLREARRRIEEPEKWGKYPFTHRQECVYLAIRHLNTEEVLLQASVKVLRDVIGQPIITWNDAPERTHADVLAAFDRAIALAESEEEKT